MVLLIWLIIIEYLGLVKGLMFFRSGEFYILHVFLCFCIEFVIKTSSLPDFYLKQSISQAVDNDRKAYTQKKKKWINTITKQAKKFQYL